VRMVNAIKLSVVLMIWLVGVLPAYSGQGSNTANVSTVQIDAFNKRVEVLEKKVKDKNTKDLWDKISSSAPLISGLLVALIGAFATYLFNKQKTQSEAKKNARELSILEVQTVESFLPHLSSGDEASVKAALYAIEALGNQELTTKLGGLFGGKGALEALLTISGQREGDLKQRSSSAIGNILSNKRPSVVQVVGSEGLVGTGFFVDDNGLIVTVLHVIQHQTEVLVKLVTGETYNVELVKSDEKNDLAYLRINDFKSVPLPLFRGHFDQPLAQVAIIGNSPNIDWETRIGTMIGSTVAGEFKHQVMDLPSSAGYSGAPIFNSDGVVIGILRARDREGGKVFSISTEVIQ
jgi:S1-C subfamily serine protease